jgi:hypothetical protein
MCITMLGFSLLGFDSLVIGVSLFLPVIHFRMGMLILCLTHHCILEADNLFFSSMSPQVERKFAPG